MVASSLLFCFVPSLKNSAFTGNNNAHQPRTRSRSVTATAASSSSISTDPNIDLLPEIREAIAEADGEQAWKESAQLLSDLLDSSEEEAELYLADAFRWKAWANASDMMKRFQKPTLPNAEKVREALSWLKEGPLEMSDEQVRSNIRDYPGIYLVEPIQSYRKVMGSAPRKYRDAAVLKELINDDPNILQVTYNCDGEGCQSECGSCWVAYESRLPSIPEF
mmetsp:Transcript_10436/g.23183  ORF Transcript_10436/g.23183 Transcript_10436/m.23183 type:complete len:221 (-) Transcript_10436:136-798(-)